MYQPKRFLTTLFIFLSGAMLIPFISLPAQAFSWQLFANAYEDVPILTIDHDEGGPGSFFEIKGDNFPPNATVTITVNGTTLGTWSSDADGKFEFELDTSNLNLNGDDDGVYFVTVTVNPSATIRFTIDKSAPVWPSPSGGTAQSFNVPAGIAFTQFIYFPIVLH